MKLKLEKMGKSLCAGPLIDHVHFESPWPVGEYRFVDEELAIKIMAKYPGMFKSVRPEEEVVQSVKSKRRKIYSDKMQDVGESK